MKRVPQSATVSWTESAPRPNGAANDIEESAAEVAGQAEHLEDVVGVGVELALHGEAEREHADDGDRE